MADEVKNESAREGVETNELDAEALNAAEGDEAFTDDDVDVSAEVRHEFTKLEECIWHAPKGAKTRIAAVAILVLLGLSLLGLIIVAVITAVDG